MAAEEIKNIQFTDSTTDLSDSPNAEPAQLGEKQWYVCTAYSTHEARVKENLLRRIESMGIKELVSRVIVAEVEVPVIKDGVDTGKTRKKNLYPGYIYIEMIMTDHAWDVIRNTPGVTGFVGSSGKGTKPFPIPREEIEPVLKRMGMVDDSMYDRYNVGDLVKVIKGPLEGTEGKILSIDKESGVVQISTMFFGRTTNTEVDFSEIEKI